MAVYSSNLFLKKGPLGRAWVAAHFERKLGRSQVNEADILKIADAILDPEAKANFSLRIFAYLLLGLVRLYSRKLEYLLRDSSESLRKIKKSFPMPAASNVLPAAAEVVITMSVDFDEIEPLSDHVWSVHHNVSLAEHITLSVRDDDENDFFQDDERFPPECTPQMQIFQEPANKSFPPEASDEPAFHGTEGDEDDVADEADIPEAEGNDESPVHFEPRTPPTRAVFSPRIHRLGGEPSQRPPVNRVLALEFDKSLSQNQAGVFVDTPQPGASQQLATKQSRGGPEEVYLLENAPSSCGPGSTVCGEEDFFDFCELAEEIDISPQTPAKVPPSRCHQSAPPRKRKRIAFDRPSILRHEVLREQLRDVSDLVRSRRRLFFRRFIFSAPSMPGMCSDLQEVFARSPQPRASDSATHSAPKEATEEPLPKAALDVIVAGSNDEVGHTYNAEESVEHEPAEAPTEALSTDNNSSELTLNFSCSEGEAETEGTCTSPGCSERTKVLGRYLKSIFNRDSRSTRSVMLDRILSKKSRRVAACTFFDLLVLKTRDYIQVEQPGAYQSIQITLRPKLMEDASL